MNNCLFNIPLEGSSKIVESLKSYLVFKGYIIQEFLMEDGLILQIKKGGWFKTIIGLSVAINININQTNDCFSFSFSNGKWANRVAAGSVSLFFLYPLLMLPLVVLITSIVGAYRQSELPGKITSYINGEISKYYKRKRAES